VGIDKDDDLIFASINEVASIKQAPNKAKDEIAIVYAEGGIDMGETNGVNTAKLVEDLTKIQNDKNVKAVVLRVNSPGGSAYGLFGACLIDATSLIDAKIKSSSLSIPTLAFRNSFI